MSYLKKLKSHLSGAFASAPSSPARTDCRSINLKRRRYLKDQIDALESEIRIQQKEMELSGDIDSSLIDIKRRLVRTRDIRYKASLLRLELGRCSPSQIKYDKQIEKDSDEVPKELNNDSRVRVLALRHLLDIERDDYLLICLRCLADVSTDVRHEAVRILKAKAGPEISLVLLVLLKDESPRVRAETALALGTLRSRQSVYTLFKALGDEHTVVRKSAKEALSQMFSFIDEINICRHRDELKMEITHWIKWWTEARVDYPVMENCSSAMPLLKIQKHPYFHDEVNLAKGAEYFQSTKNTTEAKSVRRLTGV